MTAVYLTLKIYCSYIVPAFFDANLTNSLNLFISDTVTRFLTVTGYFSQKSGNYITAVYLTLKIYCRYIVPAFFGVNLTNSLNLFILVIQLRDFLRLQDIFHNYYTAVI